MYVSEFIDRHKLTLEVKPVGEHVIDGETPFKWEVAIMMGSKMFSTEYTMGAAHVAYRPAIKGGKLRRADYGEISKRKRQLDYGERHTLGLMAMPPDLAGVLESVQLDCRTIEDTSGFPEWARDLGYDDDSIKAKAIYDACVAQYFKAKTFFGLDFQDFLGVECDEYCNTPPLE